MRDADDHRRARLNLRFGILGAIFGTLYAAFYQVIGHHWGALIILVCSVAFGLNPLLLARTCRLDWTGQLYAATLVLGFTALCVVEGGLKGHAIAWLASVPLCVLLLVETRHALAWTVLCTIIVVAFGGAQLAGIEFPATYPPGWTTAIDLAGYAGLVPFMALLGLIFEVTRRRAFDRLRLALDELSQANQRLVRLNEEKNEFLNIAAHDLKNPLGVISGYAGLLHRFNITDPAMVKEQAGEIVNSANRMLDIISNLLDTRAIEDGRLNLRLERCPIEPLVETLLRDYSNAATAKRIVVSLRGTPSECVALADRGATHQILDNLLSNAIKYSPMGHPVILSVAVADAGGILIEVIDHGPGLSEEDQGKLFGKFTRLTPRPTAGESSNGLGLWIVKRMAESMGGDVSCQSQLGKGSTFRLRLPECPRTGATDAAPAGDAPDFAASGVALSA